jgi:hypothetical protein
MGEMRNAYTVTTGKKLKRKDHLYTKAYVKGKLALLAKHNQNDQVKEDEMGGACSTNGGDEECV